MHLVGKLLLVFVITYCANWLHNALYDWTWQRIGASYPLGDLWEVLWFYGVLYLLCFAAVAVFGTSTPKRIVYGSLLVLVGSFLPLFATDLRYYLHAYLPVEDFVYREHSAYLNLLVTHGVTLLGVNLLFLLSQRFALPHRPVPA